MEEDVVSSTESVISAGGCWRVLAVPEDINIDEGWWQWCKVLAVLEGIGSGGGC